MFEIDNLCGSGCSDLGLSPERIERQSNSKSSLKYCFGCIPKNEVEKDNQSVELLEKSLVRSVMAIYHESTYCVLMAVVEASSM